MVDISRRPGRRIRRCLGILWGVSNVTANVRGTTKCAGDSVDLGYSIAKKVGLYMVFTHAYGFMQSQVFGGGLNGDFRDI